MGKTLVTGGVRSGKSRYAESLLHEQTQVTYIATGYPVDKLSDADWARRVAHHQAGRPDTWHTVETRDVAQTLSAAQDPVLIDCIGLWVTRTLDAVSAWEAPDARWESDWHGEVDRLADAWQRCTVPIVAVTNEVGWGVVPDQRAGRLFADCLGRVNQRLGAVADEVVLLVAGRALRL